MIPDYPLHLLWDKPLADFVNMVDRAEEGEAFTISRDGSPLAVVIGIAEYEDLIVGLRAGSETNRGER